MVYATGIRRLYHALLPPRCVACDASARWNDRQNSALDLCQACFAVLPLNHHACLHCALPLTGDTTTRVCGRCLRRPPLFHRACAALRYEYPANHLIQRLKYGQSLPAAPVLGQVLATHLEQHYAEHQWSWPESIVPVPLHAKRYRQRGYNQVIEVGRHVAKALNLPLRTDLLTRSRDTPEQTGLTRQERRRNLRGAFTLTGSALPAHVAVLDDVMTTASTLSEISKQLRRAGVQQIDVWAVARAALR